jgi:hypothetical protein
MPPTNRLPQVANMVVKYVGDLVTNSLYTTYTVTVVDGKYVIDGTTQPSLTLTGGNTYVFKLDDATNSRQPLGISTTPDGVHKHGVEYFTGVTYTLDGSVSTWSSYKAGFAAATTRSITFIPSVTGTYYYYAAFYEAVGGSMSVTASDFNGKKMVVSGGRIPS